MSKSVMTNTEKHKSMAVMFISGPYEVAFLATPVISDVRSGSSSLKDHLEVQRSAPRLQQPLSILQQYRCFSMSQPIASRRMDLLGCTTTRRHLYMPILERRSRRRPNLALHSGEIATYGDIENIYFSLGSLCKTWK